MIAAYLVVKAFAFKVSNYQILLRIDNTTAISHVNKISGDQYKSLNLVVRKNLIVGRNKKNWLFASYIAFADNMQVGRQPRVLNIDTKWELNFIVSEI